MNTQLKKVIDLLNTKQYSQAVTKATELVSQSPAEYGAWAVLGAAQSSLHQYDQAVQSFSAAVKRAPNFAPAYNNLGTALQQQEQFSDALDAFSRAIQLNPQYADAHYNKGLTFQKQKKYDSAISSYLRVIELDSSYFKAYINLAEAYRIAGKFDEALRSCLKARELQPNNAIVFNNIGSIYRDMGDIEKSLDQFKQAIKFQPNFIDALNNLGISLHKRGDLHIAKEVFERVISLDASYPNGHFNLGNVLRELGKFEAARSSYSSAVSIDPNFIQAEAQLIHVRQHLCDFKNNFNLIDHAKKFLLTETAINPWVALSWIDDPQLQLSLSQRWATDQFGSKGGQVATKVKQNLEKVKVGYYSADMHNHPAMYLISGLLAAHDREQFEIYAFSYGPKYDDEMRRQITNNVDSFFDISNLSDEAIRKLTNDLEVDIAIDCNGYTRNGRTDIFQNRIAPLQVSFLGYPSTLGAPFVDYMIADQITIPVDYRQFYTENIIYLPHTYWPTDNTMEIDAPPPSRAELGLPEDAFVLCCFNSFYKISSKEFSIWMRLLNRIPDSVLWLLKTNDTAVKNLKALALEHGIDSKRLIFAEFVSHNHHLSRLCRADLFIDTFNCNAHTTASDALYVGVPVVTKIGKQFSARVAASLLHAVGLSELVTHSEEEYEELIFDLASTPKKFSLVESKLQKNKNSKPLFDTQRYTRNFEKGLKHALNSTTKRRIQDIFISDLVNT